MPPQLCSNCRTAFDGGASRIEESDNVSPLYYIHRNYQSFAQSRQSKCRVCYDLWTRLAAGIEISVEELSGSGLVVALNVMNFPGDDGKPRYIFWMYSFYVKESTSYPAILKNKYISQRVPDPQRFVLRNESYQFIYSRILVLTESLVSENSRSLEAIGSSSKSQPSRELISSWVRSCVDDHPECKPWRDMRDDPASPARILDVGERGSAKIYLRLLDEENVFDEDYNTLSYCRGNSKPTELTKNTLDGLVAGIEPLKLSKTFRNSVALTRQLGVRYLWIDSLCVFQDSEEDRRIEGEKSGDIYGNGLVNICAADADNCDGGLFFDREAFMVQPLQIKIPWPIYQSYRPISDPSDSLPPKLYDCGGMGDLKQIMNSGPVNERAWPLQERFVSRRTLYCCKEQLYWECKRGLGNESFPNGLGTAPEGSLTSAAVKILDRIANEGSWKMSKTSKMEFQPPSNKKLVEDAYGEWIRLIETYTACGLTRHEDILVAFSGIAKRFETLLGDRYISGLLIGDLCVNLLWFTKDPSAVRLSTEETEETWQAPTWSWAAVKGKVEWDHTYLAEPRFRGELLEGNFLEYIGHERIKLVSDSDVGGGPSTIRLRVKAFWISLFGYLQRPPAATAIELAGVHSRVLWMRTNFAKVHFGFGQFDSPEIIRQVSMKNGGLEIGSVIGIPVRWNLERTPGAGGSEKRILKVTGLLVRPARGYSDTFEVLHRIGRFTLQVPHTIGTVAAENALLKSLKQSCNSEEFKEYVLV